MDGDNVVHILFMERKSRYPFANRKRYMRIDSALFFRGYYYLVSRR